MVQWLYQEHQQLKIKHQASAFRLEGLEKLFTSALKKLSTDSAYFQSEEEYLLDELHKRAQQRFGEQDPVTQHLRNAANHVSVQRRGGQDAVTQDLH